MSETAKPRILVVEDEPEILAEVSGFLRRRGEIVKTAGGFSAAMQALTDPSEPIDMLISDVRMPDGSGVDLIRFVLERSGGRFPCLLMTGHFGQSDLAPELEGAVRIVFKPFSLSALYREVKASLEGCAAAKALGAAA
jgi:DNA-binding NtrC family response regulator